jgi:hypothetical protein
MVSEEALKSYKELPIEGSPNVPKSFPVFPAVLS